MGVNIVLDGGSDGAGDSADDSYTNVERWVGSDLGDGFAGSDANEEFHGGKGNDTALGGGGDDVFRGGAGIDRLYGEAGDDQLYGGAGDDYIDGGAGADLIDDGTGYDTVSYASATSDVYVVLYRYGIDEDSQPDEIETLPDNYSETDNIADLVGEEFETHDAGGDRLISIEAVIGSDYDDVFVANIDAEVIDGGDGYDWVSYEYSLHGVVIDTRSTDADGYMTMRAIETVYVEGDDNTIHSYERGDKLKGIEVYAGTSYDDVFYGSSGDFDYLGGDGDDRFISGTGDDYFLGGFGDDTFVVTLSDGSTDIIADFIQGEDVIDFTIAPAPASAVSTLAGLYSALGVTVSQVTIQVDGESEISTIFKNAANETVLKLEDFDETLTLDDFTLNGTDIV